MTDDNEVVRKITVMSFYHRDQKTVARCRDIAVTTAPEIYKEFFKTKLNFNPDPETLSKWMKKYNYRGFE